MTPPNIPTRYRSLSPTDLAGDLGRMAAALIQWAKGLPDPNNIVPIVSDVGPGGVLLAMGTMARVSPREDEWITLILPQPNRLQGGRKIQVVRLSELGTVELIANGCTVNGLTRLQLLGDMRLNTIATDGQNYFLDNQGALSWGYGL